MSAQAVTPLAIDFVADVVCPWCYLGWVQLKAALALRPQVEGKIVWRPYQLDPNLPEQGVDRADYMARKFPDRSRIKAAHEALLEAGAAQGIEFHFDRIALAPNTNAAQRLIRWSQGLGVQDAVVEALFVAYFTDGRDIGDPEVLADIGAGAGMDKLLILDLLSRDEDADAIRMDHRTAAEAGVTGVPFTIFAGQFAVIGAEAPPKLVRAIDHALANG